VLVVGELTLPVAAENPEQVACHGGRVPVDAEAHVCRREGLQAEQLNDRIKRQAAKLDVFVDAAHYGRVPPHRPDNPVFRHAAMLT